MITIEEFLISKIPNAELSQSTLQVIAYSPADVGLMPFALDDEAYQTEDLESFLERRNYMESNLWYAALGLFSGGSVSEKIGDESFSKSGHTITEADRDRFKSMGDALRAKAGHSPLELSDEGYIDDGACYKGLLLEDE